MSTPAPAQPAQPSQLKIIYDKTKLPLALICSLIIGSLFWYYVGTDIPFGIQITAGLTCILFCGSLIMLSKKNKGIAFLLAFAPCIPLNRIYIGNLEMDTYIWRFLTCGFYDIYRMFIKKDMVPSDGWSNQIFPFIGTP